MFVASCLCYEEVAVICGVEIGTIKSRVSRARAKLSELMGLDDRRPNASGRAASPAVPRLAATLDPAERGK
jgi:RNA polymerase sigma-70 factor (ECF subfamily)